MARNAMAVDLYYKLLKAKKNTEEVVDEFVGSYTTRGIRECFWWGMIKQDIDFICPENELRIYYEKAVNSRRPSCPIVLPKSICDN